MRPEPTSADWPGLCFAIHEHAPLPMAALEGADLIVRYANAAFCRLIGQARAQLNGKPLSDIVPKDDECLLLLDRVYRSGEAESHSGQPASNASPTFWSYTMWPVRVEDRPMAVMFQVTESARLHGRMLAMNEALVLGAVRQHQLAEASEGLNARLQQEMAERRQAELAMSESEARYRNLFDSMDEGYCIIEVIFDERDKPVDWRYLKVNPAFAKLTGLSDAVGKRMRELAPDHEACWFETFGQVVLSGEAVRFVSEAKALKHRWFDSYAFKVDGPDSRKVAVLFTNITEKRRNEQQALEHAQALADLDRRKDEFLAMLSHELRNPMAAISSAVHLLRLQKNGDPVHQHAHAVIERQVGQLTHLVDDLLEVSRISTGRVQLRRDQLDLRGIVVRAVETVQSLIDQHAHTLTVAMPTEPIWLHADAARLEQALVNLLTNAAKYTDNGGRIDLSVDQEVGGLVPMAVIKVRDSGIGIAPEVLPHVFDLFAQAERTLARSQGGLGIGLCLVRRLVELHGGTVMVVSVLGQGSEFVVRLPLLPGLAAPAIAASRAAQPAVPVFSTSSERPAGKGCRVLVVDDNVDAAQSLAVLLEMSGHAIELAYDGEAALEAAIHHRPELVLLDIGLPGLDGYQVAQRIRRQSSLKNTVLVALTGYGAAADRQRSQQAGFDYHLVKPANLDEIEEILRGVMRKKSAL
jgi:signal transduction histidine kinase/ActR/RegA family two-component response regulator